jgi:hypothetical protein
MAKVAGMHHMVAGGGGVFYHNCLQPDPATTKIQDAVLCAWVLYHDNDGSRHAERSAVASSSDTTTGVVRVMFKMEVPWKGHVGALVGLQCASFALALARLVEGIALLDVVRLFTGKLGGVV